MNLLMWVLLFTMMGPQVKNDVHMGDTSTDYTFSSIIYEHDPIINDNIRCRLLWDYGNTSWIDLRDGLTRLNVCAKNNCELRCELKPKETPIVRGKQ